MEQTVIDHLYESESSDRTLCKRDVKRKPRTGAPRTFRTCRWCEAERLGRVEAARGKDRRSYHERLAED